MQIPYEVKPRPDTGLWNAKIGIWLFLASEVMLFGGLFSGYLFLRLGAAGEPDYFWPEGELNVWFGFINTLILILSSVFVVIAWLQLKLREYRKFQIWMVLVVICAFVFLINKGFEYSAKFKHWGIKISDNSIVHGHGIDDTIKYEGISEVTLDSRRFNGDFLDDIVGDAPKFRRVVNGEPTGEAIELSRREVAKIANGINEDLRKAWKEEGRAANKAKNEEIAAKNEGLLRSEQVPLEYDGPWLPAMAISQLSFAPEKPFAVAKSKRKLRQTLTDAVKYKDQTTLKGTISKETPGVKMESIDRIDLRATDAEEPEGSLVWNFLDHGAEAAEKLFFENQEALMREADEKGKEPDFDELMSQKVPHDKDHHTSIVVPWENVKLYSNFTPKWNTYYAIYFTLTGLHGLHVLAGALVLLYFCFRSKWLYDKDPEHLANRVEVGGLFWHFVDLVWIFLFPILYLM